MLLAYGVCFTLGIIVIALIPFIDVPVLFIVTEYICSIFVTVANPSVQTLIRLEIQMTILS